MNDLHDKFFFNNSPDASLIITDGPVSEINLAAAKMFRCESDQITGKAIEVLFPDFQPDGRRSSLLINEIFDLTAISNYQLVEWVIRRFDGEDFYGEVSLAPISHAGKLIIYACLRDISARKTEDNPRGNEISENPCFESEERKRTAATIFSPDGRKPVSTIAQGQDKSKRKLAELRLSESEQRYRLLIESANEGILVGQGLKLRFVNQMVVQMTGYSEEELLMGQILDFIHPDDLKLLMENQSKRLNGETVDLRYQIRIVRKDKSIINLSAKINGENCIEFAIRDTGIGMSQQLIDELFRLGVQTGRRGTAGEESTGLGLLLCKEFIEKLGGKLWVQSIEEKGSTFYFTILQTQLNL